MSLPPGPRSRLASTWAWLRRPTALLDGCARRFGSRFTLRFVGNLSFVLVSDPEDVKAAFTGSPDLFLSGRANADVFGPFLGRSSLIVIDGDPHRRHRRLLMPPFRGERMRAYGELMRDLAYRDMERWPRGRPFAIEDRMHEITQEVIFEAVFGLRDRAREAELRTLLARLVRLGFAMVLLPALQVDLGPLSPFGRFVRVRAAIDRVFDEEVARARSDGAGREDILAKLVEQTADGGSDPWTDAELRDELLTLFVAGHETTRAALGWAFQWILGTPGVRERAIEEVRDVVGDAPLEPQKVAGLKYLDAAIQESMRISPVFLMVARALAAPATIGGVELAAGTVVCPSMYLTQRDPRIYPDPERFDPERFLERRPGPFEFYPFGGGSRLCIGLAFASYEMKIVLASVLARADLRLAGPARQRPRRKGMIIGPERGTPVVLEKLRW